MRLWFDITQFVRHPWGSGIQRVLLQLALTCGEDDRFAIVDEGDLVLLSPQSAETLLRLPFDPDWDRETLVGHARDVALGTVPPGALVARDAAYVIAELTYERSLLYWWHQLLREYPTRVGAIFYDASPELDRALYGGQAPAGASGYFRLVSALGRVVCISHDARRQLSEISHRPESDFEVAPLGADHLTVKPAAVSRRLVVVGDLKAKKRVDLVLQAYESVRSILGHDLVVIGRPVAGQEHLERLVQLAAERGNVIWLRDASDEDMARELSWAAAAVFVAANEGFGLPALEALHAGVPVIVDESLPALRYVEPAGQVRLSEVSPRSIAEALVEITGPAQARLRREANSVRVPTWESFVATIRAQFDAPAP